MQARKKEEEWKMRNLSVNSSIKYSLFHYIFWLFIWKMEYHRVTDGEYGSVKVITNHV